MSLQEDKQLILAGIETTARTEESLDATHAMLISNPSHRPLEGQTLDRNNIVGFPGHQGSIRSGTYCALDFEVELGGSGTVDLPVKYAPLWRMCGVNEAITASTKVDYTLISTAFETGTIYYYADTSLHKMIGCIGNVELMLGTNGLPKAKFSFQGLYIKPDQAVQPVGVDYSGFKTPLAVNAANVQSCTLYGQAIAMTECSVSPGVQFGFAANTEEEAIEFRGRQGFVNATFKEPTMSTINFFDIVETAQEGAFGYQLGNTAGKIFEAAVPNLVMHSVERVYVDKIAYLRTQSHIRPTAANNDMSWTTR